MKKPAVSISAAEIMIDAEGDTLWSMEDMEIFIDPASFSLSI